MNKTLLLAGAMAALAFTPLQAVLGGQVADQAPRTGAEMPRPGGHQNYLRTCCDPAAANLSWSNVFSWDETTGTLGSRYGVKFDPAAVPGLHGAMHNTAMMAAVMNGTPGNSYLLMMGDLRTDNKDGGSWPTDPGAFALSQPARAINAWNNAGGYTGFSTIKTGWLGFWSAFDTVTHSGVSLNFDKNNITVPHLRGDTTRYTMRTSLMLWYRVKDKWYQREVICNNVPIKYFGWQRGGASFKMASGNSVTVANAPAEAEAKNMRLGAPTPLNPEQIKQAEAMRTTAGRN